MSRNFANRMNDIFDIPEDEVPSSPEVQCFPPLNVFNYGSESIESSPARRRDARLGLTSRVEKAKRKSPANLPEYEKVKKPKVSQATFLHPDLLVTFLVRSNTSDEPTRFLLHREVVCKSSPVLKTAFNSMFVEGKTEKYHEDNVSPQAFRMLAQWMYAGKLALFQTGEELSNKLADEALIPLAELWPLADKYMMHRLQNHVIECMHKINPRYVNGTMTWFEKAYENTSPDSRFRRYMIERIVSHLHPWRFGTGSIFLTQEILVDYAKWTSKCRFAGNMNPPYAIGGYFVKVNEE